MTARNRPGAEEAPIQDSPFDVVERGYDHRQVDERLEYLNTLITDSASALREADERNADLDAQLRIALEKLRAADEGPSFGFRVEKILRLAESEAKQVRERAQAAADRLMAEVETKLAQRRESAERELHQLVTLRQQVLAELHNARRMIMSMLDGIPSSEMEPPSGSRRLGGAAG